jgi:hypothetical protein
MIVIIEFSDGKGEAFGAGCFWEGGGLVSGVEFDVESTYFGFNVSEGVLFLFDDDTILEYLVLDGFDLLGVFFLFFRELFYEVVGFGLEVLYHDLLLFEEVDV